MQVTCQHIIELPVSKHDVDYSVFPAVHLRVGIMAYDVLELFHERSDSELRPVEVLCLTETWHDCDSVCIRRFRALGYRVVERPRPRSLEAVDSLDVHHGGVAVIASTRVRLSVVSIDVRPTTFEFVGVRAVADRYASTVIVIYPPGSEGEVDFLRRARRRSGQSSHAV